MLKINDLIQQISSIDSATTAMQSGLTDLRTQQGAAPEFAESWNKLSARLSDPDFCASDGKKRDWYVAARALFSKLGLASRQFPPSYGWNGDYERDISALCAQPDGRSAYIAAIKDDIARMPGGFTEAINGLEATIKANIDKRTALQQELDKIQKQIAPARIVADNLPWLLLITFIAGGGILFGMRFFDPEIQRELVISGQILQFVTVLILLSVLLALGMSNVLGENTLGTLIGGLAGYVLSQGVGNRSRTT